LPRIFLKQWFRWLVFALFMIFIIFRLAHTGGKSLVVGSVFVSMCILTTLISIVLGIFTRHRGWCAICPMGTLQEKIYKIRKSDKEQFSAEPK
jgi:polyferredoxin